MKTYSNVPENFHDIEPYLITAKDDVISHLLSAKTVFFYDACSIIHHSKLSDNSPIILYIINNRGIIVLTRTVLMELTSSQNGGIILPDHMKYLQMLSQNGLEIVLFDEEYCYDCLDLAFTKNTEEFNQLLGYSVMQIKRYQGAVTRYFDLLPVELKTKLYGQPAPKKEEFSDYFQIMRSFKSSGDSLAEELMFICFILLQGCIGRIILLSDDTCSSDKFLKTAIYIRDYYQRRDLLMFTTAVFCYKLYKEGLLPEDKIVDFLSSSYAGSGTIRIYAATGKDIEINQYKISTSDFAALIRDDKELRIFR